MTTTPTQKQIDAMRPRVAASWQADAAGRNLIFRRSRGAGNRWRVSAVYLSHRGHPCTPALLLWSDDPGLSFSRRLNWRTIHNAIKGVQA